MVIIVVLVILALVVSEQLVNRFREPQDLKTVAITVTVQICNSRPCLRQRTQ